MPSRFELSRDAHAPAAARHAVRESCPGLHPKTRDAACLLISELVANSVQHGSGDTVTVLIDSGLTDTLRCEVIDDGRGFVPGARAEKAGGGWGLQLVDQLSSSWGVHDARARVWFDLPTG